MDPCVVIFRHPVTRGLHLLVPFCYYWTQFLSGQCEHLSVRNEGDGQNTDHPATSGRLAELSTERSFIQVQTEGKVVRRCLSIPGNKPGRASLTRASKYIG